MQTFFEELEDREYFNPDYVEVDLFLDMISAGDSEKAEEECLLSMAERERHSGFERQVRGRGQQEPSVSTGGDIPAWYTALLYFSL